MIVEMTLWLVVFLPLTVLLILVLIYTKMPIKSDRVPLWKRQAELNERRELARDMNKYLQWMNPMQPEESERSQRARDMNEYLQWMNPMQPEESERSQRALRSVRRRRAANTMGYLNGRNQEKKGKRSVLGLTYCLDKYARGKKHNFDTNKDFYQLYYMSEVE